MLDHILVGADVQLVAHSRDLNAAVGNEDAALKRAVLDLVLDGHNFGKAGLAVDYRVSDFDVIKRSALGLDDGVDDCFDGTQVHDVVQDRHDPRRAEDVAWFLENGDMKDVGSRNGQRA